MTDILSPEIEAKTKEMDAWLDELDEQEKTKLAELTANNPDTPPTTPDTLSWLPDQEQSLLACMFAYTECAESAARLLPPDAFIDTARSTIYRFVADYWKAHQACPTFQQIEWHLEELHKTDTLPAKKPKMYFDVELFAIKECEPTIAGMHHHLKKIETFSRWSAYRANYKKEIDLVCDGKWDQLADHRAKFQLPAITPSKLAGSWDELEAVAESQKEDWLLPNWAEFGGLTLFSSLPKLGKSTILSQLIADCMLGRDNFYGVKLQPSPVLVVDPENRERTLHRRIKFAMAGENIGKAKEWFFTMPAFAKPLNNDLLAKTIKHVQDRTGIKKITVILDTLRSCYSGKIKNENDNSEMAEVIVAIKDIAAATGACIILVHHNSKGSDSYAGGTAILGSVDYHWNWQNDRKSYGELSCFGRGDFVDPIQLKFNRETQRNELHSKKENPGHELAAIPWEATGTTTYEMLEVAWKLSKPKVRERLNEFINADLVKKIEPAKKTDPVRFCRKFITAK